MNIFVLGLNHDTAPVEIREKFFLNPKDREAILERFRAEKQIKGAIILSTCNRTEIYIDFHEDVSGIRDRVLDILFNHKNVERNEQLEIYFYGLVGGQAARHLLKVATGLDSLVLGEKQILGQIKKAVEMSRESQMLSKNFNLFSNIVIRAGKKSQTETLIGCGGASVSWAAVQLAEQTLGSLSNKSILIIGAGKMSELTASQLASKGVRKTFVINRTIQKAVILAEKIGGTAHSYLDLYKILSEVDLCIVSASAPNYIVEKQSMTAIMQKRQYRKLVCIDISTPRNIDPQVVHLQGVNLYKIDDLREVVDENLKKRQASVDDVRKIIDDKMLEFDQKLQKNIMIDAVRISGLSLNYFG